MKYKYTCIVGSLDLSPYVGKIRPIRATYGGDYTVTLRRERLGDALYQEISALNRAVLPIYIEIRKKPILLAKTRLYLGFYAFDLVEVDTFSEAVRNAREAFNNFGIALAPAANAMQELADAIGAIGLGQNAED